MRPALINRSLSKTGYADSGGQADTASPPTLPSSEHGHAPLPPDLPRAPRHALSRHSSLPPQRRREAQRTGRAAALPSPPKILALTQAIREDPDGGAEPAAGIEQLKLALSVDGTSQGSRSATTRPLDAEDILNLMQTINEKDLHDGAELAELAERIERAGAVTSQHSGPATATPTNPDIPRLLQAIREKNSDQCTELAALVERLERESQQEGASQSSNPATAPPNPDVPILLQQIRKRVPNQATALTELVERTERLRPDRETTCFPVFRRATR
ncbi:MULTISPECIES: type III effector protein XopY [Xanthomonas translucens group]|uniref:Type III effector protein XopY n=1 Tax=Xanthomonas cerealis pv. cerealis TaxID=152263 RepID=A0A514E977_9XANT|nr:type III effector protein XopY [Xanthomonas translucens]QDI02586.1 type III effector protein XopY [Xanthomonas translucens pv. cerealis]UKE47969.1 type III effector protein XopY [Xanthomonas translucens pv. cerealis]